MSAWAGVAAVVWALVSTLIPLSPVWATAIGSWSYTSLLQVARAGHGMAGEGNTLYVVGGHDATSGAIRSVEYAAAGADGGLSAWQFSTPLNEARTLTTAIGVGGHVYAIGGARHWSLIGEELNSVEFAAIQPDGSLGPWQVTAALTGPRANAVALAHGGFIYVVGGYGGGQLDSVERASVLPDGTLGLWAVISHMSRPRERPGAAISSNTLVVLGGYSYGAGIVSTTETAPILGDGTLGSWTAGPTMSVPRYHLSAVSIGDLVFALGGYNDGQFQSWVSTEKTEVRAGGIGPWTAEEVMQEPRSSLAASVSGRHVYVSGGTHGLYGAWNLITSSVEVASPPVLLTALGPAKVWIGLRNSDAVGLRVDLRADVSVKVGSTEIGIASGSLNNLATGSSGFGRAILYSVPLGISAPVEVPSGSPLNVSIAVRRTCAGSGHTSGTVRLWYNGAAIDTGNCRDAGSRFVAAIGGTIDNYFHRANSVLNTAPGSSPLFVDRVLNSDAACPDRPFTTLETWSITLR